MPIEDNENGTIGASMSVLDSLITSELRLVKKYLLDSQGRLRLYHPVVQRILFDLLKDNELLEEVKKYHEAEKKKKKDK